MFICLPILILSSCISESISSGRSYYSSSGTYSILFCSFSRSSVYTGSGGVVYLVGTNVIVNIEDCMFYNCVAKDQGGAIVISSSNGQQSLNRVCANMCYSTTTVCQFGKFAILKDLPNSLQMISVLNCGPQSCNQDYSIRLEKGNQEFSQSNSSNNYCPNSPVFVSTYFASLKFSYSTIFQNYGEDSGVNILYPSSVQEIRFNNFAKSIISASNGRIIYTSGSLSISYSVFRENSAKYLFYVSAGTLSATHSYLSHGSTINKGTFETINCSALMFSTYHFYHFNSYHCFANTYTPTASDIPLIRTQTLGSTLHPSLFPAQTFGYTSVPSLFPTASFYPTVFISIQPIGFILLLLFISQ